MASFQDRIVGAIKGQASTFAEIMQDPGALTQAIIVVAAASLSGALGNFFRLGTVGGPINLVVSPIFGLIAWGIGCAVLWVVGTKVITGTRTTVDLPQTLRTLGFAQAPGLAGIAAIVPYIGTLVPLVLGIYSFYLALVATKELFGYPDFVKAFLAVLIAAVAIGVTFVILGMIALALGVAGATLM